MIVSNESINVVENIVIDAIDAFGKGELCYQKDDITVFKIISTVGSGAIVYAGTKRIVVIPDAAIRETILSGINLLIKQAFDKLAMDHATNMLISIIPESYPDPNAPVTLDIDTISLITGNSHIPGFTQICVKDGVENIALYPSTNDEHYFKNFVDAKETIIHRLSKRIMEGKITLTI